MRLDLSADLVSLTRALCDVPSVSGDERELADVVEEALRALGYLEVLRDGDAVVARTHLGRDRRVVLAGHLDTVPVAGNLPSELREGPDGPVVWGRGTVDMKAGDAVLLAVAAAVREPSSDVTYVFYDAEEVESARNGLGRLVAHHPDWVAGDMAVLGEPTAGALEGGCNGTLRVEVAVAGRAAHSARSWLGCQRRARRGARCSGGWWSTPRARSTSTAWSTARASTRWASAVGSPGTSSPTSAW